MYLSKLELHGFKSFATGTVLQFDPGITAIVGPNGCGKSNIVDAVRWVIGEQRARILRSEKMENIIFNGTSKRRPLGMAEVLLTVENNRGVLPTEYSEVTLGRRLYRSGESEYLLNGTPCRLKDIVDLFMDTGMGAGAYSVIELKMIEEILSENAQDRRHLFEEAAGITKYKQRRSQTLRKLDGTQADLTRLRDLTEEIERRVNSLKRQAAKAARFKDHEARLHQLELALAQVEHDRLTEQAHLLQAERQRLNDVLGAHTARMAKDEAALEALRKTLIEREQALSKRQQHLNEHLTTVRDLESDLRLEQERLDGARREQERTASEQDEAQVRHAEMGQQAECLAEELAEAMPLQAEAERVLQDTLTARDAARAHADTHREALQNLRREEHRTAEEHTEHLRHLDRLVNRVEILSQEQGRLQGQRRSLGNDTRDHEVRAEHARSRRAGTASDAERARYALQHAEHDHQARLNALEDAQETLHQIEREHDAVAAEIQVLESLVSSFEEFSDAVQFLASAPAWSTASLQTVADLLACDPAHRVALDAALGELASCIVVQTDAEAQRAIALLRGEQKGRATFLVLNRLPEAPPQTPVLPGDVHPMHTLVRTQAPAHANLSALLLRGCYFVASLEQAQPPATASPGTIRFFDPDGEWVDGTGLVHAGSTQAGPSPVATRLGRREQLEAGRAHLQHLATTLARHNANVEALRTALEALPLDAYRQAVAEAEQILTAADREHTRAVYEQEAHQRRCADLDERLTALHTEVAGRQAEEEPMRARADAAADRLAALQAAREAAEAAFLAAEANSHAAQDRYSEAHIAAVEVRNRRANLERDHTRTRADREALAQRIAQRRALSETLQQTIDAAQECLGLLEQRLATVRTNRDGLEEASARAKTGLLQTRVDIDQVEVRLRKLRQAREETIHEENVRAVRQAEIKTRKEDLLAGIREDFDRDLTTDPVAVEEGFEEQAARDELQDLRRTIQGLGSVNALALEEYEAEKARFEFMHAQKEDLEQAEATLRQTIDEINTTAAARFDETFEAIRTNFSIIFEELFGQEADADLSLAAAADPLESPIDIMAKPRGKRPISISQLSSGEKTLTAIALLFAIYLVKPSPFCILDEVDAPLDDANVDRFMRLIRRFSGDTQFILVTHNKRTMELADRLYGITMQEQGVSRLVGVRFDEALALAE